MNCIFCKIINNEINSYTIYEDDIVKCFFNINPESNGHILIVPKKHYTDLFDIDNTITYVIETAKKLSFLLKEKLNTDGFSIIQNNGDASEVKHFHIHLKPFYNRDYPIMNVEEIYNILTK